MSNLIRPNNIYLFQSFQDFLVFYYLYDFHDFILKLPKIIIEYRGKAFNPLVSSVLNIGSTLPKVLISI